MPKPKPATIVYRCRNGHEALIQPSLQPGPLAVHHKAFTYVGVLRMDSHVPWGIHRWRVTGEYVYNTAPEDSGWDLILDTRREEA